MRLSRNARFAAPFVVAAVIGAGAAVPKLASGGPPHLPPIGAAALVTKMANAHPAGLSGTVALTANLGLPAGVDSLRTGSGGSGIDLTTLLSGTHHFDVWLAGGDRQRLSLTHGLNETDVIRDGSHLWLYDSTTEKVTQVLVGPGGPSAKRGVEGLIRRFAPVTTVEVGPAVEVAGKSCYTLRLVPTAGTPDARDSSIGRVDVAVDAANGAPLRVEVFSKAGGGPAVVAGFVGSVSFAKPSSALFAAPDGLRHSTATLPDLLGVSREHGQPNPFEAKVTGSAWAPVVVLTGVHLGVANALVDLVTVPTHGIPGSPRALRGSLVNALIYPDGRIVAGLATQEALQAAAAAP